MGRIIGTVTNQEITTFKNAGPFRVLDVQLSGSNPEKVIFFDTAGQDTAPLTGDTVVVYEIGGGVKVAMSCKDQIDPTVDPGEKEIYSTSGGAKAAVIKWNGDGTISMYNLSEDWMTLLTDLIDEIHDITTYGSPGSHSLTAVSKAALDAIKVRAANLFS